MYLVRAMKIDTNNGYNKEVGPAINKVLVTLQGTGCKIHDVAQQGVDGRNAYIIVKYDDGKEYKKEE